MEVCIGITLLDITETKARLLLRPPPRLPLSQRLEGNSSIIDLSHRVLAVIAHHDHVIEHDAAAIASMLALIIGLTATARMPRGGRLRAVTIQANGGPLQSPQINRSGPSRKGVGNGSRPSARGEQPVMQPRVARRWFSLKDNKIRSFRNGTAV